MVHFPAYLLMRAMCSRHDGSHPDYRVTPFGHPRIVGRWHLPAAFRSYPRPSSSGSSQASSLDPFSLDHIILPVPSLILFKNLSGGTGTRTLDPRLAKPML